MDDKKLQDDMVKVVKENKHLIEEDLRSDDKFNKIKNITIDYDSVKHNPMGGIMVEGYVENDKNLKFTAGFNKNSQEGTPEYDEIEGWVSSESEKLDDYLQKETK